VADRAGLFSDHKTIGDFHKHNGRANDAVGSRFRRSLSPTRACFAGVSGSGASLSRARSTKNRARASVPDRQAPSRRLASAARTSSSVTAPSSLSLLTLAILAAGCPAQMPLGQPAGADIGACTADHLRQVGAKPCDQTMGLCQKIGSGNQREAVDPIRLAGPAPRRPVVLANIVVNLVRQIGQLDCCATLAASKSAAGPNRALREASTILTRRPAGSTTVEIIAGSNGRPAARIAASSASTIPACPAGNMPLSQVHFAGRGVAPLNALVGPVAHDHATDAVEQRPPHMRG
jgi:hypothetical protein